MAAKDNIEEVLASSMLFADTSASTRQAVAGELRPVAFAAERTIFSRGDPGRELYLVLAGRVRLQIFSARGRELAFAHAGPGALFGEIAALDGGRRTADAVAATAVEAMSLGREQIARFMATRPDFAASVVRFLCQRLRATDDLLESIGLNSIEVRIARLLLLKAQEGRDKRQGSVVIEFPYAQAELAALIGATRPKVSQALAALEAAGAIRREPGAIACNLERLQRVASGEGE